MSVLLAVSKVSRASLPSRSSLLLKYVASTNDSAVSYVVVIISRHILDPGVGIRVISRLMRPSVDWNRAITTLLTCMSLMVRGGTQGG
jgi:hypothetical protein